MNRLLAFGGALVDEIIRVPADFSFSDLPVAKGGATNIDDRQLARLDFLLNKFPSGGKCAGGAAASALKSFAKLGGQGSFCGMIGDDESGDLFYRSLAATGLDLSGMEVVQGGKTGRCITLVSEDADRTMLAMFGVAYSMTERFFEVRKMFGFTHCYMEGFWLYYPDLLLSLIKNAKLGKMQMCLDFASRELAAANRQWLKNFMAEVQPIIFGNREEAQAFCGEANPEAAAKMLSENCRIAVVKDGINGAYIAERNCPVIHIPVEAATPVDTTGAGDFWAGGFLYGLLSGASLADAGALGAKLAAQVVSIYGTDIWK